MDKLDNDQIRQGDVMLIRRDSRVNGDDVARDADGSLTLAHGEVTGHRHRFVEPHVHLTTTKSGARHLRVVKTEARLLHEEHSPASLAPGSYDMPKQVEWTDDLEPRVVAD